MKSTARKERRAAFRALALPAVALLPELVTDRR